MVEHVFNDRAVFHDGDTELASGLTRCIAWAVIPPGCRLRASGRNADGWWWRPTHRTSMRIFSSGGRFRLCTASRKCWKGTTRFTGWPIRRIISCPGTIRAGDETLSGGKQGTGRYRGAAGRGAAAMNLSTELAIWASAIGFEDLPDDVIEATRLRVMDVIGLSLAGAETPFGKSTRAAAGALTLSHRWAVPDSGDRRPARRNRGGVREWGVLAGAGIRRYAQRIDRAYEQPRGGRGAGAVGDRSSFGARVDHCDRVGQRDLVPGWQRGGRAVSQTRLSSDGAVRNVRHRLSCIEVTGARRASDGASRGCLREFCLRPAAVLGGWDAD